MHEFAVGLYTRFCVYQTTGSTFEGSVLNLALIDQDRVRRRVVTVPFLRLLGCDCFAVVGTYLVARLVDRVSRWPRTLEHDIIRALGSVVRKEALARTGDGARCNLQFVLWTDMAETTRQPNHASSSTSCAIGFDKGALMGMQLTIESKIVFGMLCVFEFKVEELWHCLGPRIMNSDTLGG